MERVRRPRISAAEKAQVWQRWKCGESLSDIGRALERVPGAIFHVLAARGGVAPPPRTRSRRSVNSAAGRLGNATDRDSCATHLFLRSPDRQILRAIESTQDSSHSPLRSKTTQETPRRFEDRDFPISTSYPKTLPVVLT